jgi:hypothetical protein
MKVNAPRIEISNDWVRLLLVFLMYLSCLALALAVFQVPLEIRDHGEIPLRIMILVPSAVIILLLVAYLAAEPAWKTLTKLVGYILALCCVIVMAMGLQSLLSLWLGDSVQFSSRFAAILVIFGALGALIVGKAINSSWLN